MISKSLTISWAVVFAIVLATSSVLAITPKGKERLRKIAITTQGYALQTASDGDASPTPARRIPAIAADYSGAQMGGFSAANNPPSVNQGVLAGRSFIDKQHYGSAGRRIVSRGADNCISCAWTQVYSVFQYTVDGLRYVNYNGYDPVGGLFIDSPSGAEVMFNRAGFASIDGASDDGSVVVAGHSFQTPFYPFGRYVPAIIRTDIPCYGAFVSGGFLGGSFEGAEALYSCYKFDPASQFLWPRVAVTNNAGTKVLHVLSYSQEGAENNIIYMRNTTFPFSNSGPWSNAIVVGSSGFLSYDIAASRTTNRVIIAWAGGRGTVDNTVAPWKCAAFGGAGRPAGLISQEDGSLAGESDNDLNYIVSPDAGASWSNIQNVTQYPSPDGGGFRVHASLSALITSDEIAHIAFTATQWTSKAGPFGYRSRIFHWDDTQPKGYAGTGIRTAVASEWDPADCNPGIYKQNVCNPQLAECEGKLYLTFESYADITKDPPGVSTTEGDDCADRAGTDPTGAADADIYVSVSSNGGYNWDVSRPLMYSYTPGCDFDTASATKADCESAAWSSTLAYGISAGAGQDFSGVPDMTSAIDPAYADQEYLFTFYVDDLDPGSAYDAEGTWTQNDMKLFRFGCVDPILTVVGPLVDPSYIGEPTFVLPGTFKDTGLSLYNFGNADMAYSMNITTLTGTAGNVKFSDGTTSKSGVVSSGAINFANFTLRLNATLSAVVQSASAQLRVIHGTVSMPNQDTTDVPIAYPIANIEQLDYDSIASSIIFGNNANLGREQNFTGTQTAGGVNMDFTDEAGCECDTTVEHYLYDASPLISIDKGAPLNNIVVSGMYNFPNYWDSTMFRPLDVTAQEPCGSYTHGWSGRAVDQDTTVAVMVDYYWPTTPLSVPAGTCAKYMWVRVAMTGMSATPVDSVYLAYAMDADVPGDSGSRNSSEVNTSGGRELLSVRGYETFSDTGNGACTQSHKRWLGVNLMTDAGAAAAYDGTTGSRNIKTKQAMYTRDQATYLGGAGGWDERKLDSALHTITGNSTFSSPAPESAFVDLHAIINGGAFRVNNADTIYMWFQMYSGYNLAPPQWYMFVDAARVAPPPITCEVSCCQTAGDADNDNSVTIGDAVYLIAYIFLGGGAPPCVQEGDADGDASITIGDAVYLISYIFLGGSAPVCGP